MGLLCNECGYDNDPTRVYCHSCGKRLERGAETVQPPSGFTHPTEVLKAARAKRSLTWGAHVSAVVKLLVLGALITGLVLALMQPTSVPPPVPKDEQLAARLSSLLADASSADSTRAFAVSAGEVNQWLVSVVEFQPPDSPMQLRPDRIFAVAGDGVIRAGLVAELPLAWPLYIQGDYAPVRGPNGYTLEPRGFSVGRLHLPVLLGWPVERQFAGLGEALSASLEALAKASNIEITPEAVNLRWSGSGR